MTCSKIPFPTKEECTEFIQFMRKDAKHRKERGPKDKKKLRSYLCPKCGNYHVTSQKPRKY